MEIHIHDVHSWKKRNEKKIPQKILSPPDFFSADFKRVRQKSLPKQPHLETKGAALNDGNGSKWDFLQHAAADRGKAGQERGRHSFYDGDTFLSFFLSFSLLQPTFTYVEQGKKFLRDLRQFEWYPVMTSRSIKVILRVKRELLTL